MRPLPVDEAIFEFIPRTTSHSIAFMAEFIKKIYIPEEAIETVIDLWIKRCRELRMGTPSEEILKYRSKNGIGDVWKVDGPEYFGVPDALRERKRQSEEAENYRQSILFRHVPRLDGGFHI